jgi:hypothetical protein
MSGGFKQLKGIVFIARFMWRKFTALPMTPSLASQR